MKKLFSIIMITMLLILGSGCSAQENKGPVPAPSIESQLSEAHREFQEKKNFGQIAFYICGGIVIAGVLLFKVGAIITAFISGKRLAERRRKEKRKSSEGVAKGNVEFGDRKTEVQGVYGKEKTGRARETSRNHKALRR